MLILYQQVHQGLPCRSAHPPQASARGNGGRRCAGGAAHLLIRDTAGQGAQWRVGPDAVLGGRVLGRGGAGARHHWLGSR